MSDIVQQALNKLNAEKQSIFTRAFSPYWRIPVYSLFGIAVAAFILHLIGWFGLPEINAPVGVSLKAKQAKEVAKIPKIDVPIKAPVKVYGGGKKPKKDLNLPSSIINDDNSHILASSKVNNDDHPHTITTVINDKTGESETFVRTDPLPWLAWDNKGEAGIYIGIKNMEPATRLEVRQGIFQVKAIHFQAIGSADVTQSGKSDYFLGVGGIYRW
jgi:hypothetical protein